MKKLKLSVVVVMLVMVAAVNAQATFGVKGGINLSNLLVNDERIDEGAKVGFHVGLAADYEFYPNMSVQSGLFFTTKGFKAENEELDVEYTENLMYLQLPVHFAYKLPVTSATRLAFHAGPYIGYGVGGKRSLKAGSFTSEWDVDKIFGDGTRQYKPFDAGLGLGVGVEFTSFIVDLGWDMGLVNISNASSGSVKNQNAYLSVGYIF